MLTNFYVHNYCAHVHTNVRVSVCMHAYICFVCVCIIYILVALVSTSSTLTETLQQNNGWLSSTLGCISLSRS